MSVIAPLGSIRLDRVWELLLLLLLLSLVLLLQSL